MQLSLDVRLFFEVMELRASAALHCSSNTPVSHSGAVVAPDNSCVLLCDRMLEECVADLQAAFAQAYSDGVRLGRFFRRTHFIRTTDPFRPLFDRFASGHRKMGSLPGSLPPVVHDWDPALSLMTQWLINNPAATKYANPQWAHLLQIVLFFNQCMNK